MSGSQSYKDVRGISLKNNMTGITGLFVRKADGSMDAVSNEGFRAWFTDLLLNSTALTEFVRDIVVAYVDEHGTNPGTIPVAEHGWNPATANVADFFTINGQNVVFGAENGQYGLLSNLTIAFGEKKVFGVKVGETVEDLWIGLGAAGFPLASFADGLGANTLSIGMGRGIVYKDGVEDYRWQGLSEVSGDHVTIFVDRTTSGKVKYWLETGGFGYNLSQHAQTVHPNADPATGVSPIEVNLADNQALVVALGNGWSHGDAPSNATLLETPSALAPYLSAIPSGWSTTATTGGSSGGGGGSNPSDNDGNASGTGTWDPSNKTAMYSASGKTATISNTGSTEGERQYIYADRGIPLGRKGYFAVDQSDDEDWGTDLAILLSPKDEGWAVDSYSAGVPNSTAIRIGEGYVFSDGAQQLLFQGIGVDTDKLLVLVDRTVHPGLVYIHTGNPASDPYQAGTYNFKGEDPASGSSSIKTTVSKKALFPRMNSPRYPAGKSHSSVIATTAAEVAAMFPGVTIPSGYQPLATLDQTATTYTDNTTQITERTGGLTADYVGLDPAQYPVNPQNGVMQPVSGDNVKAYSTLQVLKNYCINTHNNSSDYLGGGGTYNENKVVNALTAMGFYGIRDSLEDDTQALRVRSILDRTNCKLLVLTGANSFKTMDEYMTRVESHFTEGQIIGLEDTNEANAGWNSQQAASVGKSWPEFSYEYTVAGIQAKASRSGFMKNKPLVQMSFTEFYQGWNVGGLIVNHVYDYGNNHDYEGGRPPASTGYGGGFEGSGAEYSYGDPRANIYADSNLNAPGKPYMATEFGYAVSDTDYDKTIPYAAAPSYIIRTFLNHLGMGYEYSFIYDLINDDSRNDPAYESVLGFVNTDGTLRPHAQTVANFFNALREDFSNPIVPGTLSFTLGGDLSQPIPTGFNFDDGSTPGGYFSREPVLNRLIQFQNGDFGFAIAQSSIRKRLKEYDQYGNLKWPSKTFAAPAGRNFTWTLKDKTPTNIRLLDPTTGATFGTSARATASGKVITLTNQSDVPNIVRFSVS